LPLREKRAVWILLAAQCSMPAWGDPTAGTLPPGFRKVPVVTGLDQPTVVAFAPDGRLLVCERTGRVVQVIGNAALELFTVPGVDASAGESGLLGLAFDPDFVSNGYLYVFYVTRNNSGPLNRVSRFTMSRGSVDPASERVIWEIAVESFIGHFAGCLAFRADGTLLVSTGDIFIADRAQDLFYPNGKILRMRSDGAPPTDNPFAGLPGAAPYIWAYGLRNPFRFTIDPATQKVYAADVGYVSWEEVNHIRPGQNYGWPYMEGPQCYIDDCSAFSSPIWSYAHGDPNHGGRAVIMGPVYRGPMFPEEFHGNLFVGDFTGFYIRRLILDAAGRVVRDELFDRDAPFIVDLKTAPDGALYYASLGWGSQNGGVYRIEYSGGSNIPPVVAADATPRAGRLPLTVRFSSAGTFDPDSGPLPLSYHWDFGDGAFSTEPHPEHVYQRLGSYRARLTVSDGLASSTSDEVQIVAGLGPELVLTEPQPGTFFRAGQNIRFAASAFDEEDGELPASAFTWNVLIHRPHNAVNLFLGPLEGIRSGEFVVPTSGRPLEDSYFRIECTVRDSDGLTVTAGRDLHPLVSLLRIETVPSGIPVFLNEHPLQTPYEYRAPVGYRFRLEAQRLYRLGEVQYRFAGWNGDESRALEFTAPEGGLTLVATYQPVTGGGDALPDKPDSSEAMDSGMAWPCWLPCLFAIAGLWLLCRPAAGGMQDATGDL